MAKPIRKEAWYPHPPEKVWVALTDRRALAEWLMPNDHDPVRGHQFRFQTDPTPMCGSLTLCEVLEADPPHRLVWSWLNQHEKRPQSRGAKPSTVTWTLSPENGGTRLVLLHEGLEVFPWLQRVMLRMGWGHMVKRWIPKVAANVTEDGRFTPGVFPLEKRCYKCKTIPDYLTR